MSEQARLAILQEKLKEAKSRMRTGDIFLTVGAVLIAAYFVFVSTLGYYGIPAWGLLVPAIISLVIGFVELLMGARKKASVLGEMEKMATKIPSCPKCGKPLPQGNHAFCPFCGTAIRAPP